MQWPLGGPATCTNEIAACNEGYSTGATRPEDCLGSPVVDAENGPPGSFCCDTAVSESCNGGCLCFEDDLDACAAAGCYPTFPLDGGPGSCGGNGGPVICGFGEIATGKPPPNCGILTATNSPIAVVMMDGGFCCENPYADAGADAGDASTDAADE